MTQDQPTTQELKAAAYDLISQREEIDRRLGRINQIVHQRERAEPAEEQDSPEEAPPEEESEE